MKSLDFGPRGESISIPLPFASLEEVNWEAQQTQLAIGRRAYELFRSRGAEHGYDWEDWFQAEAEFLQPVPIASSESDRCITICANVLGYKAEELRVAIEPHHVTIIGKRKIVRADAYPDRILCFVNLDQEIVPARAAVQLKTGVLRLELPKAAKPVRLKPIA